MSDDEPRIYDFSDEDNRLVMAQSLFERFCNDLIDAEGKGLASGARARLVSGIQIALGQAFTQGKSQQEE